MSSKLSVRGACLAALGMLCLASFAWGQESEKPAPTLGDLARQTRAQHADSQTGSNKAQAYVDEMQAAQDAADNAPVGFTNYDAGDYRLFVPYPFSLEGRDNGSAVLLGSRLGITNTEVMAGTPVPIPANIGDNDLISTVNQIARHYAPGAYCSLMKGAIRKTFLCTMGEAQLLGHQVWASMEFVVASNKVVPVICASPDNLRACQTYDSYGYYTCNSRYPTWDPPNTRAAIATRNSDARSTAQACEQVIFPSITLKEDIVVHPVSLSETKTSKAAPALAQDGGNLSTEPQGPSLADLARRTRQAAHGVPQAKMDTAEGISAAPPGYQPVVLQYCWNPQICSEATIAVPEKAEVISRTNGQHIFKTLVQGEPVFLYAGPADVNAPYRSLTDPDYVRMRDLGNANGWSHEKADAVSTQEMTIENRNGLMTRFRYQRDQQNWWVGERILIQERGLQFMLGCTAREEHFAAAESVCTTLVSSLRLP